MGVQKETDSSSSEMDASRATRPWFRLPLLLLLRIISIYSLISFRYTPATLYLASLSISEGILLAASVYVLLNPTEHPLTKLAVFSVYGMTFTILFRLLPT